MLHPSPEMILFYLSLSKGSLAVVILQGFFNIVRKGGGGQTHVKKIVLFRKGLLA